MCLCAEQQTPWVAHQLAANRVVALPVQVWVVLAARGLNGDLQVVKRRESIRIIAVNRRHRRVVKQCTWTQSSTPSTEGRPATAWNSWKDSALVDTSLIWQGRKLINQLKVYNNVVALTQKSHDGTLVCVDASQQEVVGSIPGHLCVEIGCCHCVCVGFFQLYQRSIKHGRSIGQSKLSVRLLITMTDVRGSVTQTSVREKRLQEINFF